MLILRFREQHTKHLFTKEKAVKIIRDETLATLTFVPVERNEKRWLSLLIKTLKVGDLIKYDGREDDRDDHRFCDIHLRFGKWSKKKEAERLRNDGSYSWSNVVDGYKLKLSGSTEQDRYKVNDIRNGACYVGQLIFLGEVEVDGQRAIVLTIFYCPHCGVAIIDSCSCEWRTCNVCAAKCEHNWVEGLVKGGGIPGGHGVGKFCDKCGRGKMPTRRQKKMSQAEHAIEIERKLGFKTIYKNTPLTPHQVDRLQKAAASSNN